jgi:protein-tyrosine-phosphatase
MATTIMGILGRKNVIGVNKSVLFTCRANVARSQMAAGYYRVLTGINADSGGFVVDNPGQPIGERPNASRVVAAMLEDGIDVSQQTRRLIKPHDLDQYDQIVNLGEAKTTPSWVNNHPHVTTWQVDDPRFMDLAQTRVVRDHIKELVKGLIQNG